MEENARFGARLRELREAKGFTQSQIADMVGVTVRSISRLETGVQEATWPVVVKLAGALGVDCTAFQQAPASDAQQGRGRPSKEPEGPEAKPAKKKGRKPQA